MLPVFIGLSKIRKYSKYFSNLEAGEIETQTWYSWRALEWIETLQEE